MTGNSPYKVSKIYFTCTFSLEVPEGIFLQDMNKPREKKTYNTGNKKPNMGAKGRGLLG